ncbi:MAG: hypothetical protein R3E79_54735 [Caldilineaceae bacterium]
MRLRTHAPQVCQWLYPLTLLLIYLSWSSYMTLADRWHLFSQWWPMSLSMVLGSFVAGADVVLPQGVLPRRHREAIAALNERAT